MLKRSALLSILAVLTLSLACCGRGDPPTSETSSARPQSSQTETAPADVLAPEDCAEILGRNGDRLGLIDKRGVCTAADEGVFYSLFQPGEYGAPAPAQYRLFRAADGRDVLLGTLEDQGYEAVYARTEQNGVLYTLALTGNPYDSEPDTLWLLAFDPAAGTMSRFPVSDHGHPYAAMTASDGKLVIMNHEMTEPQSDKVYEFDPSSGAVREILCFSSSSVSLRSVCAADGGFYLLRLTLDSEGGGELFLDRYDHGGQKRSELPLNDALRAAAQRINGIASSADAQAQLQMSVSGFAVTDGRYLYYENFSVVRLILDLETGEPLLAQDDTYSMSVGGGNPVFYRIDFEPAGVGPEKTEIFAVRDGELQRFPFTAPEGRALLLQVSRSPAGAWLVQTADDFAAPSGMRALCWRPGP